MPSGEFRSVSSGGLHTCAIRTGGTLACWGDDSAGQVGDAPSGEFLSVAAGGLHTCAIRAGGTLACWGDDSAGQASDIPVVHHHHHHRHPWFWWWPHRHHWDSPVSFRAISAGGAHTCGVTAAGALACWGDDSAGQLDDVPSGEFRDVSSGTGHSCAIRGSGEPTCWGDGTAGQLDGLPPGPLLAVSAGGAHTCAMTGVGALACWGSSSKGQVRPEGIVGELGPARVGAPYLHRFETTPQAPGPEFAIAAGTLPPGLVLGKDGELAGTPIAAGKFAFTVVAGNGVTGDVSWEAELEVAEAKKSPAPVVAAVAAVDTGPPPPIAGKTFNIDPVSGTVRARCSDSGQFVIPVPTQISIECLIDTRNGTADLTTSKGNGDTQSAQFWGGLFSIHQEKGHNWRTELALAGRLKCEKRKSNGAAKRSRVLQRRKKGGGRRLWGSGRGSYSTSGNYGSATVRGTTWLVADRCDGSTLFSVKEGTVWVRDFVIGISRILNAGQSYVAKAAIPRLK